MPTVTIHEAKTKLSEILRRVEAGEEIVIARGATPIAVIKGYDKDDVARRRAAAFGCLAGKVAPPPDSVFFDPMTPEELAPWEGDDNLTDPLRTVSTRGQRRPRSTRTRRT